MVKLRLIVTWFSKCHEVKIIVGKIWLIFGTVVLSRKLNLKIRIFLKIVVKDMQNQKRILLYYVKVVFP